MSGYGSAPQTPRTGEPQNGAPAGGFGRDLARELGQGVAEIGIWAAAVLVFVGLPGLVGFLVGDALGLVVGAVLGAVVLGVVWLVLLVKGVSLAAAMGRRRR